MGYGAGVATAVALYGFVGLSDQPFALFFKLGITTVIVSLVFLCSRLAFEVWAKDHAATVDRILNTPEVQEVLERDRK